MKISIDESAAVAVVAIEGNIMQEYVGQFRGRLADLVDQGRVRIVLDMCESSYMSSMCLAAIVEAKNRTNRQGGDVVLASVPELVMNLLQITNLVLKFQVYSTVKEAVASFDAAPGLPSD